MLQGIIFDLDGVITDTAKYHFKAWKEIAEKIKITIDEKFNENLKGIAREEALEKILEYGKINLEVVKKKQLIEEKNNIYVKYLEVLEEKDILPGVENFIKTLKNKNIKIAIASSSKNAPYILKKLNLEKYVDFIANPSLVKKGKPAPDLFLLAMDGLALKIDQVIGIEDSEAGVQAMKNCNMGSIGIGVVADMTLKNTAELDVDKIIKFFKKERS